MQTTPSSQVAFTSVPNGFTKAGALKIAVLVSPKLTGSLGAAFQNWPQWVHDHNTFTVTLGTLKAFPGTPCTNQLVPDLWPRLFAQTKLVDFTARVPENITSYRSDRVASCVRQTIQLFGRHFGEQSPDALQGGYDKSKFDGVYRPWAKDHALYQPDTLAALTVPPAPSRDVLRMSGVLPSTGVQPPLTKSAQDTLDSYIHGTPEPATAHPLVDLHRFIGRVQRRPDTVDPKSTVNSTYDLSAIDFHRRLSLLSHHPSLMRALGLVLDFEVENAAGVSDADIDLTVSPDRLSGYAPVIGITKASISSHALQFEPRNDPNPPATDPIAYVIQDGCVVLDAKFALESLDIEGGGLHVASHANQHHKLLNQKSSTNAGQEVHTPLPAPPAMSTTGLALYRRDRKSASDHLASLAVTQSKTASPIFYAESLLQGFAVDICDATEAQKIWYYATQKMELFEFQSQEIGKGNIWEAAMRTGGVRSTDKTPSDPSSGSDVCVSDRICTWRGFSLAIGSTEEKKQKQGDPGPVKTKVSPWKGLFSKREITPAEGTKVNDQGWSRLHFLRRFQIATRPVYVTGDSPAFVEANSIKYLCPPSPIPLLRFERVPPPRLLLTSVLDPKDHEKTNVIVLRSHLDAELKLTNIFEGNRTRYLVPAGAPIDLVRTHSDLKQADRIERGFTKLGFNDKGDINEVICSPRQYPRRAGQPYRPDPLSKRAVLHLSGLKGEDLGSQIVTFYSSDGDEQWPDCFLNQIDFKGTKSGQPSIEKPTKDADPTFGTTSSSQRVRVKIPAGWTVLLHISSLLDDQGLATMAIVPYCAPASAALVPLVDNNISQGLHPMLTPAQVMKIYHAVNRPLQRPDFQLSNQPPQTSASALSFLTASPLPTTRELENPAYTLPKIVRRTTGPGSAVAVTFILPSPADGTTDGIIFTPSYDQKSTGKLQLSASFSEWVDEPGSGKPPFLRNQHSVVYENSISTRKPFNDGPKDVSIIHSLPDSKYYRVRYETRCSSRYADLYDKGSAADFQAPAAQHSFDVLATREPDAPKFLYVLPNFGWRKSEDEGKSGVNGKPDRTKKQPFYEHTRSCGIRVFLGRPWFSSGDDELLGVLVMLSDAVVNQMKANQSVNVANTGFDMSLQNAITRWGGDPIWNRTNPTPTPLVLSEWQLKNTKDPVSQVQLDASLRFQPTVLGACGWGLQTPELVDSQTKTLIGVVGYRPIYDEVSGNYYCDIAFDSKPLYATFLRMALVRYQPHAAPGKELSKVLLADFALLNADRTVRVSPCGWRSFSVELHGLKNTGGKNPGDGTAYRVTIEKSGRKESDITSFTELEVQSDPNDPLYHSDSSLLWRGIVSRACICAGNRLVVREFEISQKSGMRQVYADALEFD